MQLYQLQTASSGRMLQKLYFKQNNNFPMYFIGRPRGMSPWKCFFGFLKTPSSPFPGCLSHSDRILVRFQIFLFWKIWPVFVNGGNQCGAAPVSPPWLVSPYSYCWPITASRGFCAKRISSNFYIISAHSSNMHGFPIEIWSTWKV